MSPLVRGWYVLFFCGSPIYFPSKTFSCIDHKNISVGCLQVSHWIHPSHQYEPLPCAGSMTLVFRIGCSRVCSKFLGSICSLQPYEHFWCDSLRFYLRRDVSHSACKASPTRQQLLVSPPPILRRLCAHCSRAHVACRCPWSPPVGLEMMKWGKCQNIGKNRKCWQTEKKFKNCSLKIPDRVYSSTPLEGCCCANGSCEWQDISLSRLSFHNDHRGH